MKIFTLGKNHDPNERIRIFEELDRLSKQNEVGNIPLRIELCERALELTSKESEAQLWGKLQDELGCCLFENLAGSRKDNIEHAIVHFKHALNIRTRCGPLTDLASAQNNLATAYRDRLAGKRSENIEQAITYYNDALLIRTRASDTARCALIRSNLGIAYLRRIEGKRAENLEQAIRYCQQALEVFNSQPFSYEWARTSNTLAEIFRNRIAGVRAENMEKSIKYFHEAESIFTRQSFPMDWAMVQHNLGAAYVTRIHEQRAENIEKAIHHCQLALEVYTEELPQHRASVLFNLANAYRYRLHGDQAKNIEQAIEYLLLSLCARTKSESPEDWAHTQNNLGNVYLARVLGERNKNIEEAVFRFHQALEVRQPHDLPEEWAQTQNNLGIAYMAMLPENQEDNVKKAIGCYKKALTVRTETAFPEDWAETLNNLAEAELKNIPPDIEQAIHHLQETHKVYTREAYPQYWARTHNNLAFAYIDRKEGVRTDNLKQAASHYSQALEIYTSQTFPDRCIRSARALANLAFDDKQWELAGKHYDLAFEALDLLMHASFSVDSAKAELTEVQNLPARAAYAHIKTGKIEHAVEVLEKGRAQLLRESFEQQWHELEKLQYGPYKHLYDRFMQARNEYRMLQGDHTQPSSKGETIMGAAPANWQQALKKVQNAADAIRKEVGIKHPEYRHFLKSLSFKEIQEESALSPLVYLIATHAGGLALVVSSQSMEVVDLPKLEQEDLQQQIWRLSNERMPSLVSHIQKGKISRDDIDAVKGGYFSMYALWSLRRTLDNTSEDVMDELSKAWHESLKETTGWLWKVTRMDELIRIVKKYGKSAVFIPAGQLALLPLHAAWRENEADPPRRRYAMDDMNIRYVPSAHALWRAGLSAKRSADIVLTVGNPDGTLPYTEDEVSAVSEMFKDPVCLSGNTATKETVKGKMKDAQVLHFATHGHAGWQNTNEAQLKLSDGELLLPDIIELDLVQTRLAVLSACETGVPGLELLDEMIGLPAGMMQAGVPGVIASLWSVEDMSTAILMTYFYYLWRTPGHTAWETLRQAQIWLRDTTTEEKKDFFISFMDGRRSGISADTANSFYIHLSAAEPHEVDFSSPHYWAAFTYTGV